jgi:hypothetical protein
MSAPGSNFAQIQLQCLKALLHFLFSRFLNFGGHDF